jgi:hypothetical protein
MIRKFNSLAEFSGDRAAPFCELFVTIRAKRALAGPFPADKKRGTVVFVAAVSCEFQVMRRAVERDRR